MEQIKQPGMMRIALGSPAAWWVANIIHPGFHAIAVMLLMMIPLIMLEFYFSFSPKPESIADTKAEAKPELNTQENSA